MVGVCWRGQGERRRGEADSRPPSTMTTQFEFLRAEWPDVYEAAMKAASAAYPDPRTACFYARRALELVVSWAYKPGAARRLPYQDNLSALIHEEDGDIPDRVEAPAVNRWLF